MLPKNPPKTNDDDHFLFQPCHISWQVTMEFNDQELKTKLLKKLGIRNKQMHLDIYTEKIQALPKKLSYTILYSFMTLSWTNPP